MVYVDGAQNKYGRMIMCHMIADTPEELLRMARRIGVAAKWLQNEGTYSEHFDICLSKRAKAIQCGARPLGRGEFVAILRSKRERLPHGRQSAI